MPMLYIESDSTNPYYNLALEEYVFTQLPRENEYFMLWQNDNAVIVGKNQNTIEEVNVPYTEEQGVKVVRRLSGGGAVYHDLGNLNYTFIRNAAKSAKVDLAAFCIPVVKSLKHMNVDAEISGRNDILIEGKKFSGNAQYVKANRVMHHGTLLFDSDLSIVSKALKVSKDKIESKGVKSVRSRVTNIRPHLSEDMETSRFLEVLREFMTREHDLKPYTLTAEDREKILELQARYESWEWNFGRSPAHSIRKERRVEGCGKIQVFLEVKKGILIAFAIRGDYFGTDDLAPLEDALKGCPLREDSLARVLKDLDMDYFFKNLTTEEFIRILLS